MYITIYSKYYIYSVNVIWEVNTDLMTLAGSPHDSTTTYFLFCDCVFQTSLYIKPRHAFFYHWTGSLLIFAVGTTPPVVIFNRFCTHLDYCCNTNIVYSLSFHATISQCHTYKDLYYCFYIFHLHWPHSNYLQNIASLCCWGLNRGNSVAVLHLNDSAM